VSDVFFDSNAEGLLNALFLVDVLEENFPLLGETHNLKTLAVTLACTHLGKLHSILLWSFFCKNFNELDVIGLYC
jgi:hypothetical protein